MASPFDEIDAAGQAAIADRLGEAIAFIGMKGGDYSHGPDPARPQIEAVAVTALSPRSGKVADGIQGRSSTGSTRTHGNSELWMTRADFDGLAWNPKRDDIALLDPGTDAERRFKIAAVYPFGMGDVQIIINEEGGGDE